MDNFRKLGPDVASRMLARSLARTRLMAGWRAVASAIAVAMLVVLTFAVLLGVLPPFPAVAAALPLVCFVVDFELWAARWSAMFVPTLAATARVFGPVDAALILSDTMGILRLNPARRKGRPRFGLWFETLLRQVRDVAAEECRGMHHAGCRHKVRLAPPPDWAPPKLVEALSWRPDGPAI